MVRGKKYCTACSFIMDTLPKAHVLVLPMMHFYSLIIRRLDDDFVIVTTSEAKPLTIWMQPLTFVRFAC